MTRKEALTEWQKVQEELAHNVALSFSSCPLSTDEERQAYRQQMLTIATALDSHLRRIAGMLAISLSPADLTATVDKLIARVSAVRATFPENWEARQ